MADLVRNLFGGAKAAVSSVASDADFADFATAAAPSAPAHAATSVYTEAKATATSAMSSLFSGPQFNMQGRPYTKWYKVWERTSLSDFYTELALLPLILLVVLIHVWGVQANKSRARTWAAAHLPLLESEFAVVGHGQQTGEDSKGLTPDSILKENGKNVYTTYCTGRQNTAFLDVKLSLYKRFNPLSWFAEEALAFLFESMPAPIERMEAIAYTFDGKEKMLIPSATGIKDTSYDGFVWAVVHKDRMGKLRSDRYDLSLTSTKEHAKLPEWATVMSESAEVTEALLTPELIKAVEEADQDFESLIITDQPLDAPKKLDDVSPRKRISLTMRLGSKAESTSLFAIFLRLPDQLVSSAHFRPEALRRIKATREEEQRKLRKQAEDEKSEERRTQAEKLKKEERDRKLGRMSADEQKKYLQKEREAEQRKNMKKRTARA